jgi:hypothetical protein
VRTSIVLALITAALLGYIFVFERGSVSTREREERKGSALPEFVRARVSKLELQRKGATVVLARDLDVDVEDDAALWQVQAPYHAKADQEAIDTLLGELEWLDGRKRLEGVSAEDQKRFGLTAPRYRLWFTVGKTRVPLAVGNISARGDGVYVSTGEPGVVYVVGKELIEALNQEPGHFHSKELHEGVMMSTTAGLVLRGAQGECALHKQGDGLWSFERGASGLASVPAVQALIDAADGLRARRFVPDAKDLAKYGLDRPRLDLTVQVSQFSLTKKDAKGQAVRESSTLRLRSGAACDGHAGESYLTVNDAGGVYCAADEDLAKLAKSTADLREARLLPIEDDEIERVELVRGNDKLVIAQKGEGYTYEITHGSKPGAHGDARDQAVPDWLKALRAVQATQYDLAKSALGKPAMVLRISRRQRPTFEIKLAATGPGELIALRGDEPVALAFPASAFDLLKPEAARFRALRVADNDASALEQIEVRRGAEVERVARAGTSFEVKAPVSGPADPIATSEVARMLSTLEAVRFVADAPEPSHGLASPALSVIADYAAAAQPRDAKAAPAPARTHVVLQLGAATDGGRFAQLAGDPAVFVASSQLVDLLSAPLITRNLLATPLEQLRSVEVTQGGSRARIERSGDGSGFSAAAGTHLDGPAAKALADAVATLRATRVVGYGAPSPEQGLQTPFARIGVVAAGEGGTAEQHYTIALGAEVDGGRYARRDDRAVTFVLPAEAVGAVLPMLPATPPPETKTPAPSQ